MGVIRGQAMVPRFPEEEVAGRSLEPPDHAESLQTVSIVPALVFRAAHNCTSLRGVSFWVLMSLLQQGWSLE